MKAFPQIPQINADESNCLLLVTLYRIVTIQNYTILYGQSINKKPLDNTLPNLIVFYPNHLKYTKPPAL